MYSDWIETQLRVCSMIPKYEHFTSRISSKARFPKGMVHSTISPKDTRLIINKQNIIIMYTANAKLLLNVLENPLRFDLRACI